MPLNIDQLTGYIQLGSGLIGLGLTTFTQIRAVIQSMHPELTEVELNNLLGQIALQADERKARRQTMTLGPN